MKLAKPIFVNSRISTLFEPIADLRRQLFKVEDILAEEFLPAVLLPVPDDAPGDIPRIDVQSKHAHSRLTVAQVRCDLITNYDDAFNHDFDKCINYIVGKGNLFSKVVTCLNPDIAVSALAITVRWPAEAGTNSRDFVEKLTQLFFSDCFRNRETQDFRINSTVLLDQDHFFISTISNYRLFTSKKPIPSPHPSLRGLTETEKGLEIEYEVNDRPHLNNGGRSDGLKQLDFYIAQLRERIKTPPCVEEQD